MKKSLLLLSVLLTIAGTTIFASPGDKADLRTEQAFKKHFSDASNVKWSTEEGYLKASFTWADHLTIAYFNSNAELVGCIRGLFFGQLPLTVMRSLETTYKDAAILEINEITNDEGTTYRMLIEKKNKRYSVKMNSLGDVLKQEKIKK